MEIKIKRKQQDKKVQSGTQIINVAIDRELWQAFSVKAAQQGNFKRTVLESLIKEYVYERN